MSRFVKQMMFESLSRIMASHTDFIIVDVSRVPAATVNQLRLDLAEQQVQILSVKNAIASKVFVDSGVKLAGDTFLGASSIAFGNVDSVVLSRVIVKCVQSNKTLGVRGGVVGGQVLTADEVDTLSKSPGRLELLGQVAGLINSPCSFLTLAICTPARTLAGQISLAGK